MLTTRQKSYIVKKFQRSGTDTGSAEVQIAILTREVEALTKHLQTHPKDNHSRRGLLRMVSKRRRLMNYLKKQDLKRFSKILKELGLKK